MESIRNRSLEDLEGAGVPPEGDSYLQSAIRRLQKVPIRSLRLEDLRLLIGQELGLRFLVPMALEHVEAHPLAAGDFYRGDLLKAVVSVPETFWDGHPTLRRSLVTALERALAIIGKTSPPPDLDREFRASLAHHRERLDGI